MRVRVGVRVGVRVRVAPRLARTDSSEACALMRPMGWSRAPGEGEGEGEGAGEGEGEVRVGVRVAEADRGGRERLGDARRQGASRWCRRDV